MEGDKITKNKLSFQLKKYKFRKNIITYIYQFELFDKKIDSAEIVNNKLNAASQNEIQVLEHIEKSYETLKNIAKSFLSSTWSWERITPLLRASLIFGMYELTYNEPRVVINEVIEIYKTLSPDQDYKFLNGILDRISKEVINKK